MGESTDCKVKMIRSAEFGAGENGSLEAKAFWRDKGVIHTVVPPGNHTQNGRVDRPHLTILQSTRTLLIDSGMPGIFWAEAALNGVPVQSASHDSNVVPLSKFRSTTPKISLFHASGGKCWFRDNDNHSKIAPRYKDGKFINYKATRLSKSGILTWANADSSETSCLAKPRKHQVQASTDSARDSVSTNTLLKFINSLRRANLRRVTNLRRIPRSICRIAHLSDQRHQPISDLRRQPMVDTKPPSTFLILRS